MDNCGWSKEKESKARWLPTELSVLTEQGGGHVTVCGASDWLAQCQLTVGRGDVSGLMLTPYRPNSPHSDVCIGRPYRLYYVDDIQVVCVFCLVRGTNSAGGGGVYDGEYMVAVPPLVCSFVLTPPPPATTA